MLSNFLIVKNYKIDYTKCLQVGQEKEIFECVNQETQEKLVVKQIRKQQNLLNQQVLKLLQEESNTNIIRIHEVLENGEYWFIFMEYCDESLETLIQQRKDFGFETDFIYNIVRQILSGYMHLHSKEIILTNLNPKSILIKKISDKMVLKIFDFSSSLFSKDRQVYTFTDVAPYIAPEVFMNSPKGYTDKCDIYSLGIILHRLCYNGEFPEKIVAQEQLINFYYKIKEQPFICRDNGKVNSDFKLLIQKMIIYDPEKRYSWSNLDMQPQLQPKLLIRDKYLIDFGTLIGSGQQGQAYETFDIKTSEKLVTKKVQKNPKNEREKFCFSKIKGHKNENLITIIEIFEMDQFFYIIMEKCDMNLEDFFTIKANNLSKDEILDFAKQIINGYSFLKENKIVHRDLKLTNILVKINQNSKPIYKIIDLGTGKIITENNLAQTILGTPLFCAPEQFNNSGQAYDDTCDIFSFGLILYYLIFKKYYFQVETRQQLNAAHEDLKRNPAKLPQYQEPRRINLIEKMLVFDNKYRLTWKELQSDELFSYNQNQVQPQNLNNQQFRMDNNQIKVTLDIPIQQYLLSNIQLSLKLINTIEEKVNEQFPYYIEVQFLSQFLIRFCTSCFANIKSAELNQQIIYQNTKIVFNSPQLLSDAQNQSQQLLIQQIQKKNMKLKQLIANIPDCERKKKAEEIKQQMNNEKQQSNHFDIDEAQKYFQQYYLSFRYQIQQLDDQITLKYLLERVNNIFIDFPIKTISPQQINQIYSKILPIQTMKDYLNQIKF